jgi:type 1 glutamine amidotransferase
MPTLTSAKSLLAAIPLAAICLLPIQSTAQQTPPQTSPAAPRPAPQPPAPYSGNRPQAIQDGVQTQTAYREDLVSVEDTIPTKALATPKKPRKLLILCKAAGFVHSSIPLAAETVKMMGDKTGAYTATITYDPADINAANLAQYDGIFLDSTTLSFLDDPKDPAATEARKKALLEFVRSGKGLSGIHAAADSYHTSPPRGSTDAEAPTWPEFNQMIGGVFKFHWVYPQEITVKIDDPKSPLTAMFHGQEFVIHDEVYTFLQDSFSRKNVHVLTSVDFSKMSDADKAKETHKRTDGDYALSWIRREGKGRVFYEALGHSEHIYSMTPMMAHVLAGIQYTLGDLPADDSPSTK